MRKNMMAVFLMFACSVPAWAQVEKGLVAHWDFDQGKGTIARDASGNKNHAYIRGARFVRAGKGYALKFDGVDDFAICKDTPSLGITGPITLMAWVHPDALPRADAGIVGKGTHVVGLTLYKTGACYLYIASGGNYATSTLGIGRWQHLVGTFDGTTIKLYINGFLKSSKKSQFGKPKRGKNLTIGCFAPEPKTTPPGSKSLVHFKGMIDQVRVYDRAVSVLEIQSHYKKEAGDHGIDTSGFDKMVVTAYPYFEKGVVVVDVDCRSFLALPTDVRLRIELAKAGGNGPAIATQKVEKLPDSGLVRDIMLKAPAITPGDYEVRVVMEDAKGMRSSEKVPIRYSKEDPKVPAPGKHTVAALPPEVVPPKYQVQLTRGGGFKVSFNGQTFGVESSYSYPHGGENRLTTLNTSYRGGEKGWKAKILPVKETGVYPLEAGGKYYSIYRKIITEPSRILVKDTITNKTKDVVGILLSNHINVKRKKDIKSRIMGNPSVFLYGQKLGIGLLALDDVYQVQRKVFFSNGLGGIRSDTFGLAAGASYTVEWAVYPTATPEYYDFVNQVRQDEGLNRRVEGSFSFMSRRDPPPAETVKVKNLKYVSIGCLGHPPDDPSVSLEGIEFVEYPKECAALKKTFAEIKHRYPGMKAMFHVAHGLYVTNKPQELFGDSLVIRADGKMIDYGNRRDAYYKKYFSEQRVEEGYRWYIFYPTMDNSFGKAMLKAVDYMMDEIGATGMFGDGYISGYAQVGGNSGGYTYDRWDGHSVQIDPKTKTVTRKMGKVMLLALPVLKAVADKIEAKGGVLVTNGQPGPRSLWRANIINTGESGGGEGSMGGLHIGGRTVSCLGRHSGFIKIERDIYRDVLNKLDWGGLYFFYGDKGLLKHETIIQQMYPITVRSIHAGTIRGEERIITRHSGIYGWPATPPARPKAVERAGRRAGRTADKHGDKNLHFAYRYDGRGWPVSHEFITTVDADSVRTELKLKRTESAVVKKIPIRLRAQNSVNLIVRQYDENAITMVLNGSGSMIIVVADGEFQVAPGATYRVKTDKETRAITERAGALQFSLQPEGQVNLRIERAGRD